MLDFPSSWESAKPAKGYNEQLRLYMLYPIVLQIVSNQNRLGLVSHMQHWEPL